MTNIIELPVKKSGVASQELLQDLHRMCAEHFHNYLVNTPPAKQRASMLEVIRKFMKDNGVEHSDKLVALEALSRPEAEPEADNLNKLDLPFV